MTVAEAQRGVVEYPISGNYCKGWTEVSALRELIANALDAVGGDVNKIDISHTGGKGNMILRDYGQGMQLQHLIIGEGEDKTGQQIGQFREGFKLAMLVMARERNAIHVRSGDFVVSSASMRRGALGVDTLHLDIVTGMPKSEFTEVTVACSETSFREACNMFLAFNERYRSKRECSGVIDINPDGKGLTFVNGLLAAGAEQQLCSYALRGEEAKLAINRDRDRIRVADVEYLMAAALGDTTMQEKLQLIRARQDIGDTICVEDGFNQTYNYQDWNDAVKIFFDVSNTDKVAYGDGESRSSLQEAEDYGIRVIDLSGVHGFVAAHLKRALGCVRDTVNKESRRRKAEAARKARDKVRKLRQYGEYSAIDPKTLTSSEVSALRRAATLVEKFTKLTPREVFVYTEEDNPDAESAGVFIYDGEFVGLNRKYLRLDCMPYLLGVLAHEMAHGMGPTLTDGTREFESQLTTVIGGLLSALDKACPVLEEVDPLVPTGSPKRRLVDAELLAEHYPGGVIMAFLHHQAQKIEATLKVRPTAERNIDKRRWKLIDVKTCGTYVFSSKVSSDGKPMKSEQFLYGSVIHYKKASELSVSVSGYYSSHDMGEAGCGGEFREFIKEKGYGGS